MICNNLIQYIFCDKGISKTVSMLNRRMVAGIVPFQVMNRQCVCLNVQNTFI